MNKLLRVFMFVAICMSLVFSMASWSIADTDEDGAEANIGDMPSESDIDRYKKDGTFKERYNFMESLSDDGINGGFSIDSDKDNVSLDIAFDKTGLMPSKGNVRALVFLVNFQDTTFSKTRDEIYNSLFGNSGKTLSTFYNTASYGKMSLTGDVMDVYETSNNRDYYTSNPELLIDELMEAYDDQIDFSDYDSNNDGYIDGLYIMYGGNDTGWGSTWWNWVKRGLSINANEENIKVYEYCMFDRIDSLYHETGHLMGLDDYYGYKTKSVFGGHGVQPLNFRSNMNSYNADFCGFSKALLGWIDNVTVVEQGQSNLELAPIETEGNIAVIYPRGDMNSEQYFIVEYVSAQGLNSRLLTPGIRIYRVNGKKDSNGRFVYSNRTFSSDYSKVLVANALPNSLSDKEVLFEGEKLTMDNDPNPLYYYDENNAVTAAGISVDSVDINGGKAKCAFSVTDNVSSTVDFDLETELFVDDYISCRLESDCSFRMNSNDDILLLEDGQEIGVLRYNRIERSKEFSYLATLTSFDIYSSAKIQSIELDGDKEYTIIIPKDKFISLYGDTNDEISISFNKKGSLDTDKVDTRKKEQAENLFRGLWQYASYYDSENNKNIFYACNSISTVENEVDTLYKIEIDSELNCTRTNISVEPVKCPGGAFGGIKYAGKLSNGNEIVRCVLQSNLDRNATFVINPQNEVVGCLETTGPMQVEENYLIDTNEKKVYDLNLSLLGDLEDYSSQLSNRGAIIYNWKWDNRLEISKDGGETFSALYCDQYFDSQKETECFFNDDGVIGFTVFDNKTDEIYVLLLDENGQPVVKRNIGKAPGKIKSVDCQKQRYGYCISVYYSIYTVFDAITDWWGFADEEDYTLSCTIIVDNNFKRISKMMYDQEPVINTDSGVLVLGNPIRYKQVKTESAFERKQLITSDTYSIGDGVISDVPSGILKSDFIEDVQIEEGTSVEWICNSLPKSMNTSDKAGLYSSDILVLNTDDGNKEYYSFDGLDSVYDDNFEIDKNGKLLAYNGTNTTIKVPEGVTDFGTVFNNNPNVENIYLPKTIIYNEKSIIANCPNLKNIYLDGCEHVAINGYYCGNLQNIYAMNTALSISWCTNLQLVEATNCQVGCTLSTIDTLVLDDCDIGDRAIDSRINTITVKGDTTLGNLGSSARIGTFNCDESENYMCKDNTLISSDYKTIVWSMHEGELILDDRTEEILNYAFQSNNKITKIESLNTDVKIGTYAFDICKALKTVNLPKTKVIAPNAFNGCSELVSCDLRSLENAGTYAFFSCSKLQSVNIESCEEISVGMFSKCPKLTNIILSDSITKIGDDAFGLCRAMDSIKLPNTIKSIGKGAFDRCSSMSEAYYCGSQDEWDKVSVGEGNQLLLDVLSVHQDDGSVCSVCGYSAHCDIALYSMTTTGSYSVTTLTGGGTYAPHATAEIAAYKKNGFKFLGWYKVTELNIDDNGQIANIEYDESKLCSSLKYTIEDLNEDSMYVAVFEPNEDLVLSIDGSKFRVNNGRIQYTSFKKSYNAGSEINVTYAGDDVFCYWKNDSDKIVSTSPSYTFNLNSATRLTAVSISSLSEEGIYSAFVEFRSAYGQIISASTWYSDEVGSDHLEDIPGGPSKSGGLFQGWSINGNTTATADDIIADITPTNRHIIVTPIYESTGNTYDVTVLYPDNTSEIYSDVVEGEVVSITAKGIDGKKFAYWSDAETSGTVLSYSESYYVKVARDASIYAIYVDTGVSVDVKPVIAMTNIYKEIVDGENKISFIAARDIPTGYTVAEHGVVWSASANNTENLVLNGSGVNKLKGTTTGLQGTYVATVKVGTKTGTRVYARGYMILVKESTGNVETIYSDNILGASFDEL